MESSSHETASLWSPVVTRKPRYGVQQSRDSLAMESSSHEAASLLSPAVMIQPRYGVYYETVSLWSPAVTRQPRYGVYYEAASLLSPAVTKQLRYGVTTAKRLSFHDGDTIIKKSRLLHDDHPQSWLP